MRSYLSFARRLLRGDDVVLVGQSRSRWDEQFTKGSWTRLIKGMPHTMFMAGLIIDAFPNGTKILDVGCGNGALARILENVSGVEYIGTDISMVAIGQARLTAPRSLFIEHEATEPPPEAKDCNVLVFSDSIYYFDSRVALPHYATEMPADTIIVISITRSWRSPFVINRLRKDLIFTEQYSVCGVGGKYHTWDIICARFREQPAN